MGFLCTELSVTVKNYDHNLSRANTKFVRSVKLEIFGVIAASSDVDTYFTFMSVIHVYFSMYKNTISVTQWISQY